MMELFNSQFIMLLFAALPVLMLIDILTAWVAASITGELNSMTNSNGYKKKALMLVVMVAFVVVDILVGSGLTHFGLQSFEFMGVNITALPLFTLTVLVWQNTGEVISILENLNRAGVSMPGWINRILSSVKGKLDNYDNRG